MKCNTFVSGALFVVLIFETSAFIPTPLQPLWGVLGRNHQDISRCALNEIASKLLSKLKAGPYAKPQSWDQCLSSKDVLIQCSNGEVSCREYTKVQATLVNANAAVDELEDTPVAHFDGETFAEANEIIIMMKQAALTAVNRSEDYLTARQLLGKIMHTVQDFYSHSNWVEQGNTEINSALARHGDFGTIAEPEEQTCGDCERVECTTFCRNWHEDTLGVATCLKYCERPGIYQCSGNLVVMGKLTSGYIGPRGKPQQVGKCSHGGIFDPTSTQFATGGINKDTLSQMLSPHHNLHEQAANLAIEATFELLDDVWNKMGDKNFGRFLGIGGGIGSLVIVMDVTGSMMDEINAAKLSAQGLVDELKGDSEPPINYILSPFSDPKVGPLTVTSDVKEFKRALDKLYAGIHGTGGDNPEMCLGGILAALDKCEANSKVFVFTDAAAKDRELETQVLSIALEKGVEINFLLTFDPKRRSKRSAESDADSEESDIYQSLSTTTGGLVLFTSKSDVQDVTTAIINAEQIGASRVELLQVSSESPVPTGEAKYDFVVDESLSEITIEATASGIIMKLEVAKSGQVLHTTMTINSVRLKRLVVHAPPPGTYSISLRTSYSFDIKVFGVSHLEADIVFGKVDLSKGHPGFFKLEGQPIIGSEIVIKAEFSGKDVANLDLETAFLMDKNWNVLRQLALDSLDNGQFFAEVIVPLEPFRVLVEGKYDSATGNPERFQRLQPSLSIPTNVAIKANGSGANGIIQINRGRRLSYDITNYGPEGYVEISGADASRMVVSPTVTRRLKTNETTSYNVGIFGDPSADPGTVNTFTVTAKLPDGSVNYASQSFVLMPENIDSAGPEIGEVSSNIEICMEVSLKDCALRKFQMVVNFTDLESVLATVDARIKDLVMNCTDAVCDSYFEFDVEVFPKGQKDATANLTASCCVKQFEITAVDAIGNPREKVAYVSLNSEAGERRDISMYIMAALITAVVLLLLAVLIGAITYFRCRRSDNYDMDQPAPESQSPLIVKMGPNPSANEAV